ncbi:MAG: hypothetical protein HC853_08445 [Anaerolineae bacterium]|nr:hypothetical protein [Anaerolineae bacterium]
MASRCGHGRRVSPGSRRWWWWWWWWYTLIYNYGHHWMKIWPGYEPSQRLLDWAAASGDPAKMQVLGMGPAYQTALKD